ncbi:gliding motility-associated C-terminal domain-containing protein [Flavobacterium rivuli]|nr:gliding motility-associated C-terminal domain-containing protein [Flavobacterium rivuli]
MTTVHAQSPCTSTTITSFLPASGPVGTVVTINGSGFQLGSGTSSVKFNGVEAPGFTVVSATVIKATVPATATTGAITIITNGCRATGTSFTILSSNCAPPAAEVYISEVYDQRDQSGGMIEIYNPSNTTITFNGNYRLIRYGNISDTSPTAGYNLTLPGSIGPESTYLIPCSVPLQRICAAPTTNVPSLGNGFNGNDKLELLKNNIVIDRVEVPFTLPGFTLIRNPNAIAPTPVYNQSDWNNVQHDQDEDAPLPDNYCADLGNHIADPTTAVTTITIQPADANICVNAQATFTVVLSTTTGFTYQWKTLNASGAWVNVTNGITYSGATTATLTVNNTPASFNGSQYYCVMTSTACTLVSEAAQLNVTVLDAVVATVSATDCVTQTATVTVTSTLPGTGITYAIDGGTPQASNIFNNVAASLLPHRITVASGTCSVSGVVIVAPVLALPAIVATVSITDCATQTATVTVTSTLVGAGVTFAIDGGTPQASNIFTDVAASATAHVITIVSGTCTVTGNVTVSFATVLPAVVATVSATDCATQTATITVTSTLPGAGITYAIGTGTPQASNIFTNVAASATPYVITILSGTCSVTGNITVTPVTTLPAVVATVSATDCATQTATITVNSTLPAAGITYAIGTGTPQASNIFTNVAASATPYVITILSGTCSVLGNVTVAPVTTLPAVVATVSATDCATQTAIVTVTSTLPGAGITYAIGTGTPQASNIFTNVAASATPYVITIISGGCSVIGNVTVAPVTTLPAIVATVSATDCATQTATITVTSTLPGAGITYAIGTGTPHASNIFTNVAASATPYVITIVSGGCSVTGNVTVAPVTTLPAVVATVSATDCATQTATITVTSTLPGAGITYAIGTGTPQASNIFTNVSASATPYVITIVSGGCSINGNVTVAPVTTLPAVVATVSATDCATQTATITVTSTLPGAGITYAVGTGTPQASNIFTNVAASATPYVITILSGTCSVLGNVTVAPVTTLPAIVATVSATDCATQTATITVTSTLPGTGITYALGTGTPQASNIFTNVAASATPYIITIVSGGCSVNGNVTVNPITSLPQVTGLQECRETIFGKNYVLEALPLNSSFDVSTATFEWRRSGQTAIVGDDNTFNVAQYAAANSVRTIDFPIAFELTVRTPGGCEVTHVYTVEGTFCDIPRGISPNNDTKNDNFDLTGLDVKKLTIFNRYGLEVYNKNKYTNEWHGQTNGGDELPTGTYFYVVELEGNSRTGWVYINRAEN